MQIEIETVGRSVVLICDSLLRQWICDSVRIGNRDEPRPLVRILRGGIVVGFHLKNFGGRRGDPQRLVKENISVLPDEFVNMLLSTGTDHSIKTCSCPIRVSRLFPYILKRRNFRTEIFQRDPGKIRLSPLPRYLHVIEFPGAGITPRGSPTRRCKRKNIVVHIRIEIERKPMLPEISRAVNGQPILSRPVQRRKKHRGEYGDNRDRNKDNLSNILICSILAMTRRKAKGDLSDESVDLCTAEQREG